MKNPNGTLIILLACLVGVFVGLMMIRNGNHATAQVTAPQQQSEETKALRNRIDEIEKQLKKYVDPAEEFKLAIKLAAPAVVQIWTKHISRQTPFRGARIQQGVGSGVIFRTEGEFSYVLTNNHVIANTRGVKVVLADGRDFTAEIVGADSKTDLAVLKIKVNNLVEAILGDSDLLERGDEVIAIGSPYRLAQSVTKGIISAKERNDVAGLRYEDFLQTDAAINPGNSGGPLVNRKGEVIGINTAITSMDGGFDGVGYAIPINMARTVAEELIEHGEIIRGWLGVVMVENPTTKEIKIRAIMQDGPAHKGGIKAGDTIVSYDGKAGLTMKKLISLVADTVVGKTVDVVVGRDGKKKTLHITLGKMPDQL